MLGKLEIWFLPGNLRASFEKAASLLKSVDYDILYLSVPRELNMLVDELSLGAPYGQFIEEVKRLGVIREPISVWEYRLKPILLAIRGLRLRRPSVRVICYRSSSLENISTKVAEEIAVLTLRVNVTGKVDVGEWRSMLSKMVNTISRISGDDDNYLLRAWMKDSMERKAVCISDYFAKGLLKKAREMGIKATLRCILAQYVFTPLEVLVREYIVAGERGLTLSDDRIEKLVRMHAVFVRNYVLSNKCYDEAYFNWLRDGHNRLY